MEVRVTFRHMDSSEALKERCAEKSDKIKKYLHHPTHVTWTLDVNKDEHKAHVHVTGKDVDFNAEAVSGDMYSSIDESMRKLEEQLQRWKDKIVAHH